MRPSSPVGTVYGLTHRTNVEKKVANRGTRSVQVSFGSIADYASKQVEAQKADFVRMGVLGDWDNPYLTMDFRFEANIVRALAQIIDRGHLHRGFKPVHWCLDCGSALAQAEVNIGTAVLRRRCRLCFRRQCDGRRQAGVTTVSPSASRSGRQRPGRCPPIAALHSRRA